MVFMKRSCSHTISKESFTSKDSMCKRGYILPKGSRNSQYSSLTQPSSSGPTPCYLHTQRTKGEVFSLDKQKSVAQCLPPRCYIWCASGTVNILSPACVCWVCLNYTIHLTDLSHGSISVKQEAVL